MARKRATTRDALLLAVCDAPEDDAPRLVFADWLEENGNEAERAWATYIRAECERARLPRDDPRRLELWTVSCPLWNRYSHKGWRDHLPPGIRDNGFERGFPERVSCSTLTFLRQGKRLFTVAPVLRLSLSNVEGHLDTLLACPLLSRLRELGLYGGLDDDAAAKVAACPHLTGLRGLALGFTRLGLAGAMALASSEVLAGLTHLDLRGTLAATDPAARAALLARFGERGVELG